MAPDTAATTDRYGRRWNLPANELCPECGQPDNCGDCNHARLSDGDVITLGGELSATPWPENLTSAQVDELGELVHDTASQLASNIVNAGSDDMRDYLLSNGWTVEAILDRLAGA